MMKHAWMLWAILTILPFFSHATLTITSVSGASSYSLSTSTTTLTTIYGGHIIPDLADGVTCSSDSSTMCDTCQGICAGGAAICPCNKNGIHPNLNLTVTFKSTLNLEGRYFSAKIGSSVITSPSPLISGTTATFPVTWGAYCGIGLSTDGNCTSSGTATVTFSLTKVGDPTTTEGSETVSAKIILSTLDQAADATLYTRCPGGAGSVANRGICSYEISKGDNKVNIKNDFGATLPAASTSGEIKFTQLLFFYSSGTGDPTTVKNNSPNISLNIDQTTGSFDHRLNGLENGVPYCFILGHKDNTGNIAYFEDPATATAGPPGGVCDTPEDVEGLLDGQECFIATAAFGSPMSPYVDTLRKFRSAFLLKSEAGKKFVRFYYKHSPRWAQKIEKSPSLRAVARFFLWPIVGLAALSLKIGFAHTAAIILGFLILFGVALFFRKRKLSKLLVWFLLINIFLGIGVYSPSVQAQEPPIDDTEEGGPPQEVPFVPTPDLDELGDVPPPATSTPPPKNTEPVVPAPQLEKTPPPEIVKAPQVEKKPAYVVPKKPQTEKGKITGVESIPHPQSKKGLYEIAADGSYLYNPVEFESQNVSYNLRIGQINPPPQIDGPQAGITFESMYGSGFPVQMNLDYEWHPLQGFGKLGLQLGVGFFTSTGNGHFVSDGSAAEETYTFFGIPLSAGIVYRLQWGKHPWIAPYIAGGASYYGLLELRDDDAQPSIVGVPAGYGAAGLLISIAMFDKETAFNLANEYGVHNIWLSVEARQVQALNLNLDVSATIFSAGLVMDY